MIWNKNYISELEVDLTEEEKKLLVLVNNRQPKQQRSKIKNPKLSIENEGKTKRIMIMPNESWWGFVIYRTKRQKPISEKEARRKLEKWFGIVLLYRSL